MIKKLLLFGLICSGAVSLQAMDNLKTTILVTLADGTDRVVSKNLYALWATVTNMLKEYEEANLDQVSLPNITSYQLNLIEKYVNPVLERYPLASSTKAEDAQRRLQAQQLLQEHLYESLIAQDEQIGITDIVQFICASNYLDSDIMLEAGIGALAQYLTQPERIARLTNNQTYLQQIQNYLFAGEEYNLANNELWLKLDQAMALCSGVYAEIMKPYRERTLIKFGAMPISVAWNQYGTYLAVFNGNYAEVLEFLKSNEFAHVLEASSEYYVRPIMSRGEGFLSVKWFADGTHADIASVDILLHPALPGTYSISSRLFNFACAILSPDIKKLAVGSYGGVIQIFDATCPGYIIRNPIKLLYTLPPYTSEVSSLAWSQDSSWLSAGYRNGTIKIWDMRTSKPILLHTLEGHTGSVNSVAWSQDSKYLASGSGDKTIKIWDMTELHHGQPLKNLPADTHKVNSVAWNPNGRWLAAGYFDGAIKIWDMQQNEKIEFFRNLTFEQACLLVSAHQVQERRKNLILAPELHPDLYETYQTLPEAIKDILQIKIMTDDEKVASALETSEHQLKCCIQ